MEPKRCRDLAACLTIGFACIALRTRSLNEATLNPDESQYEATATYLLATGKSAFEFPYGTHATYELFRIMALGFGPYCMYEVRILVTIVCVAMGCGLYLLLRAAIGRWYAFLSGIWLVYYNVLLEGHTANREWFATPLLMLALWCCQRAGPRGGLRSAIAWSVAAGLVSEFSLWFKEQAVYFAVLLPLIFVLDGLAARRWRRPLAQIVGYGLGGMIGVVLAVAIFTYHGILGQVMENARTVGMAYANETSGSADSFAYISNVNLSELFYRAYFDSLRFRTAVVLAYGCALIIPICLSASIRRGGPKSLTDRQRLAAMLFFNLIGAAVAVQTGRRFFAHYYLFMLVPLAGLFGLALSALSQLSTESLVGGLARIIVAPIMLVNCQVCQFILSDEIAWPLVARSWRMAVLFAVFFATCAFLAGGVVWAFLALTRRGFPSTLLQRAIMGFVLLDIATMIVAAHELPANRQNLKLDALTDRLRTEARPADKLFVWGWLPQIYSLTRLPAATQFAIAQYIVQDYTSRPAPPVISEDAAARLFADLERFPPRFIVDASSRSISQSRSRGAIYYLRYFPRFQQYLDENYTRVEQLDDCAIYQRR